MGCVSSNLLNHEEDFTQLGSSALGHHIVSLTSTTYGLLTLDPPHSSTSPPTPPPSRFTMSPSPVLSEPRPLRSQPEVINSWELMAGLDTDSFRFSLSPLPKPSGSTLFRDVEANKENSNPNGSGSWSRRRFFKPSSASKPKPAVDRFERICPPNGENKVVIYTTTLRGVRKTFEACNAVRAAIQGLGLVFCERDISMDRGFREELRELMKGKERESTVPPRVFVKGRYVGGAEELIKIVEEEGLLGELLEGLPRKKKGTGSGSATACEGCGDLRFLPCFSCNGSCKMVLAMGVRDQKHEKQMICNSIPSGRETGTSVVVRCPDCNENGLVLCPLCF